MGVARHVLDTRHAFDGVAASYHQSNVENPLLAAMRQRTIALVQRHAPEGGRLLDLGCGPGSDAEVLGKAGYCVTGVDASPAMVAEAQQRMRHAALGDRVSLRNLGIHELDRLPPGTFDVAYSNFGPLNCVPNLQNVARSLAHRLEPGGMLIASVIGRICPWEIALYLARRDWARVRIRFERSFVAVPLEGRTVWMRYYSPAEFTAAFTTAGFRRHSLRALGLVVPPPYLQAFAGRHPALIGTLQAVEDRIGTWPGARNMGDHFLIALRKV
jgi:2-polyprenyl-3-methyl-5-hydroxy-6-metoxy-1,4-benzoquinol methylase